MNSESVIKWTDKNRPEWFSRIPIEEYEKLAGIGYTPQQIAMYYNIEVNEFMFYYSLLMSPLKYHMTGGNSFRRPKRVSPWRMQQLQGKM